MGNLSSDSSTKLLCNLKKKLHPWDLSLLMTPKLIRYVSTSFLVHVVFFVPKKRPHADCKSSQLNTANKEPTRINRALHMLIQCIYGLLLIMGQNIIGVKSDFHKC